MLCWGSKGKNKKERVEVDDDDLQPDAAMPSSASQQSMHDYIFSPKDFCEAALQKKLVPEYYLNGVEESFSSDQRSNGSRSSQDLRKSQSNSGAGLLRSSQNLTRNGMSASQGDLRTSQGNLRQSQGDASMEDFRATESPGNGRTGGSLRTSQSDLRRSQDISTLRDSQTVDSLRSSQGDPDDPTITPRSANNKRFSTFFSSTSYTNINYYEEFCHLFPHFAIVPTDGFRVELGGRVNAGQELFLQEQDAYNLAYQRIFQKNDHNNFVGGDEASPFIVSILACDDVQGGCRTIVRTRNRDYHIIVPNQAPAMKMARYALAQCRKTDTSIPTVPEPKINQVGGSFIVKDLANFEEKNYKSKHKIGVLYCKRGQTTEEEMFCNNDPSPEFTEFLDMIAERHPLRGFSKFAGGLDTKNDQTGTETYFSTFEDLETVFHVSTLLPFTPDRPVQVERKKHIGNDVVCIVFMDHPAPFRPNTITSKFIHVIIVVQFLERNLENKPVYRVSVASKPGVEPHHPILPTPPHFVGGEEFQRFMLTKVINAERAAAHAPSFKLTRTRMNGLATIVEKYTEEEEPKKGCFG